MTADASELQLQVFAGPAHPIGNDRGRIATMLAMLRGL
jgi:hypothetical protein